MKMIVTSEMVIRCIAYAHTIRFTVHPVKNETIWDSNFEFWILFKIFHTLGFYHEHRRPDRNQHIKVNWDVIYKDVKSQFDKMDERYLNSTVSFSTKYDLRSIMHYDSYGNGAFVRPAMVKLDGSIIEPNTKLSDLDIVTLNKMYPCESSCDPKNGQGETKWKGKWRKIE